MTRLGAVPRRPRVTPPLASRARARAAAGAHDGDCRWRLAPPPRAQHLWGSVSFGRAPARRRRMGGALGCWGGGGVIALLAAGQGPHLGGLGGGEAGKRRQFGGVPEGRHDGAPPPATRALAARGRGRWAAARPASTSRLYQGLRACAGATACASRGPTSSSQEHAACHRPPARASVPPSSLPQSTTAPFTCPCPPSPQPPPARAALSGSPILSVAPFDDLRPSPFATARRR